MKLDFFRGLVSKKAPMSQHSRGRIESAVQRIGQEIFDRAEEAAPSAVSLEYWQQKGMEWLTTDEDLKLRLFRFVEALPSLPDATAIAGRLRELLQRDGRGPALPPPLELLVSYKRDDSLYARLVGELARAGSRRMARQFICGSSAQEAIPSLLRLRRGRMAFTLDVLGETVTSDVVARRSQELYIQLIEELSDVAGRWPASAMLDLAPWGSIPRVNVSIKLSAIVTGFGESTDEAGIQAVLDRLRPILRSARARGAFLNIDMEHYAVKDFTLELYRRVLSEPEFRDWPECGIVIQAYLRDAQHDMAELISWVRRRGTPITVRLVKGAYWDSETARAATLGIPSPVFSQKWESDVSFEDVAEMMLRNADVIRPAFASHNIRSIAATMAMEESLGLPPRTLEIQMLTGMGDPLKRALVAMRQRLRVYAPFGDMGMGIAYLIRRLIENTANESFLRQSFGPNVDREALLSDPRGQGAPIDELTIARRAPAAPRREPAYSA